MIIPRSVDTMRCLKTRSRGAGKYAQICNCVPSVPLVQGEAGRIMIAGCLLLPVAIPRKMEDVS